MITTVFLILVIMEEFVRMELTLTPVLVLPDTVVPPVELVSFIYIYKLYHILILIYG